MLPFHRVANHVKHARCHVRRPHTALAARLAVASQVCTLPCISRRSADVQTCSFGAHSLSLWHLTLWRSASGTGARAPLSRGDQRPGPQACCGGADPWMVRWGTWGWRPQAPAADMADTHQRLIALLCFAVSCVWADCPPSSSTAGDENGRAAASRTLRSTNDAARYRQAGMRTGGPAACHLGYTRLVLIHASRTYATVSTATDGENGA